MIFASVLNHEQQAPRRLPYNCRLSRAISAYHHLEVVSLSNGLAASQQGQNREVSNAKSVRWRVQRRSAVSVELSVEDFRVVLKRHFPIHLVSIKQLAKGAEHWLKSGIARLGSV